ncbi:MAG: DUF6629 family protein [Polyangiaceae bacterium]
MCFSATASFTAAAGLAAIGVWSVRGAPSRRHAPLAAIPLLFAVQQAAEGALWLVLDRAPFHNSPSAVAQAFLFFALFVWPAYVPVSLLLLEPRASRRRWLALLAAVGIGLGVYLMAVSLFRWSSACIAYGNIYYAVHVDAPLKRLVPFVYVAVVTAPMLLSTVRGTRVLAALTIASFALTGAFFKAGFASVWCFAAAVLSGCVAMVVRAGSTAASSSAVVSEPR